MGWLSGAKGTPVLAPQSFLSPRCLSPAPKSIIFCPLAFVTDHCPLPPHDPQSYSALPSSSPSLNQPCLVLSLSLCLSSVPFCPSLLYPFAGRRVGDPGTGIVCPLPAHLKLSLETGEDQAKEEKRKKEKRKKPNQTITTTNENQCPKKVFCLFVF